MLKKLLFLLLSTIIASSAFALSDGPRFVILPNVKTNYLMSFNSTVAISYQSSAIDLVKRTLNINAASPYSTVRIRFIYGDNLHVQSLIVGLLSSHTKSLEFVRINLDSNFNASSVIRNYELQPQDLSQSPNSDSKFVPKCPDDTVQFVIGNNFDGDEGVEREVQKTYQLAKEKGYNPYLMTVNNPNGPQPTVEAYQNWMSCPNVKGFYNESHGWSAGIVLSDNEFMYTRIDRELTNKLAHEVILFDSCLTFHNPLLGALTDAKRGNAQQYVGGFISLPFGASERTATCIWAAAFNDQELNQKLVGECATKNRLQVDGYKITGTGSNHMKRAT